MSHPQESKEFLTLSDWTLVSSQGEIVSGDGDSESSDSSIEIVSLEGNNVISHHQDRKSHRGQDEVVVAEDAPSAESAGDGNENESFSSRSEKEAPAASAVIRHEDEVQDHEMPITSLPVYLGSTCGSVLPVAPESCIAAGGCENVSENFNSLDDLHEMLNYNAVERVSFKTEPQTKASETETIVENNMMVSSDLPPTTQGKSKDEPTDDDVKLTSTDIGKEGLVCTEKDIKELEVCHSTNESLEVTGPADEFEASETQNDKTFEEAEGACCLELLAEKEEITEGDSPRASAVSVDDGCLLRSPSPSPVSLEEAEILNVSGASSSEAGNKTDSDTDSDFVRLDPENMEDLAGAEEGEERVMIPLRLCTSTSSIGPGFSFMRGEDHVNRDLHERNFSDVEDEDQMEDTESSTEEGVDDRIESEQSEAGSHPAQNDIGDLSVFADIGDLPLEAGNVPRNYIHRPNNHLSTVLNIVMVLAAILTMGISLGIIMATDLEIEEWQNAYEVQAEKVNKLERQLEMKKKDFNAQGLELDLRDIHNVELMKRLKIVEWEKESYGRAYERLIKDNVLTEKEMEEFKALIGSALDKYVACEKEAGIYFPYCHSQLLEFLTDSFKFTGRKFSEVLEEGRGADEKDPSDQGSLECDYGDQSFEESSIVYAVDSYVEEKETLKNKVEQDSKNEAQNGFSDPYPHFYVTCSEGRKCLVEDNLDDELYRCYDVDDENGIDKMKRDGKNEAQNGVEDGNLFPHKCFERLECTAENNLVKIRCPFRNVDDENGIGEENEKPVQMEKTSNNLDIVTKGREQDKALPIHLDIKQLQQSFTSAQERALHWQQLYLAERRQRERDRENEEWEDEREREMWGKKLEQMNQMECLKKIMNTNLTTLIQHVPKWNISVFDDFANLSVLLSGVAELRQTVIDSFHSVLESAEAAIGNIQGDKKEKEGEAQKDSVPDKEMFTKYLLHVLGYLVQGNSPARDIFNKLLTDAEDLRSNIVPNDKQTQDKSFLDTEKSKGYLEDNRPPRESGLKGLEDHAKEEAHEDDDFDDGNEDEHISSSYYSYSEGGERKHCFWTKRIGKILRKTGKSVRKLGRKVVNTWHKLKSLWQEKKIKWLNKETSVFVLAKKITNKVMGVSSKFAKMCTKLPKALFRAEKEKNSEVDIHSKCTRIMRKQWQKQVLHNPCKVLGRFSFECNIDKKQLKKSMKEAWYTFSQLLEIKNVQTNEVLKLKKEEVEFMHSLFNSFGDQWGYTKFLLKTDMKWIVCQTQWWSVAVKAVHDRTLAQLTDNRCDVVKLQDNDCDGRCQNAGDHAVEYSQLIYNKGVKDYKDEDESAFFSDYDDLDVNGLQTAENKREVEVNDTSVDFDWYLKRARYRLQSREEKKKAEWMFDLAANRKQHRNEKLQTDRAGQKKRGEYRKVHKPFESASDQGSSYSRKWKERHEPMAYKKSVGNKQSGSWFMDHADERQKQRKEEHQADWIFERAADRKENRGRHWGRHHHSDHRRYEHHSKCKKHHCQKTGQGKGIRHAYSKMFSP